MEIDQSTLSNPFSEIYYLDELLKVNNNQFLYKSADFDETFQDTSACLLNDDFNDDYFKDKHNYDNENNFLSESLVGFSDQDFLNWLSTPESCCSSSVSSESSFDSPTKSNRILSSLPHKEQLKSWQQEAQYAKMPILRQSKKTLSKIENNPISQNVKELENQMNIICWQTPNISSNNDIANSSPDGRRIGKWMPWEDEALKRAIVESRTISWYNIAKSVPGRSEKQCRSRWRVLNRPTFFAGRWTREEDEALISLVQNFLLSNPDKTTDDIPWSFITENLPHPRTSAQASARYSERLDPRVDTGSWTITDDNLLKEAVGVCGHNWSNVSRYMGHRRGQRQCRQRYLRLFGNPLDKKNSLNLDFEDSDVYS